MENWRKSIQKIHSPLNLTHQNKESGEIINRFKKMNSKLMDLNPEVGIENIIEDEKGNKCNKWIIKVFHPFIFDNRLIPDKFDEIEVDSITMGTYPKEFPSNYAELPLEDWSSPERFVKFVENNLSLIRKTLKHPTITTNEALDAITGDFNKHITLTKKRKEERQLQHKSHIEFFKKLLSETETVFRKSEVFANYNKENWGYSITATRLEKNKPVIVGFNWGAGNNWKNENKIETIQKDYPFSSFSGLYDELGSFARVVNLFNKYLPEANNGVQTNFCFFRSQHEHQISDNDKKLCSPLFEELINYLEPSMLITFSSSLNDFFEKNGKIIEKQILKIHSKNNEVKAIKGTILINDRQIEYYNLPHPNYPITTEARLKAWEHCFGDKN